MRILGIETSCDETAAAVVSRSPDGKPAILSNVVFSQVEEHAAFGGVVPEIAARAHLSVLDKVVEMALDEAGCNLDEIDGIGVTAGPGLIGGLMVGLMTAKALAAAGRKLFIGINHLEGHALTARLTHQTEFPYLLLLVSGGHSQILCVKGVGDYERWATTIDDAAGELFDKTAKLLGLPYPGGPNVEKAAAKGDPKRFRFSLPLRGHDTLNMSFSGLKTAIRQVAEKLAPLSEQDVNDLCAALQDTAARIFAERCTQAIERFRNLGNNKAGMSLVVAGGVASNAHIRGALDEVCADEGWNLVAPPQALCTDNAAMIAWAALERFELGECSPMDLAPRSRWPLDEESATVIGAGRRGAKV